MPGPRTWRLLAVPAVAVLVAGCGGGGGASTGGSCRSAEELGAEGAAAAGNSASRALIGMAASFRGAPELAANIPPTVTPGYQSLANGKKGTWEVAVLQLASTPRALEVDFGDGGSPARMDVPAGSGACLFKVTRRFSEPANRGKVTFTIVGQPSGPPLSYTAYVDVAPKG